MPALMDVHREYESALQDLASALEFDPDNPRTRLYRCSPLTPLDRSP
jgi:hypothetical protein